MGAFFWGYFATQLLGGNSLTKVEQLLISSSFAGQLAERYRAKYVLLIGMVISTIGTLLCPLVASKGGYQWFIVLRVIIGMSQVPVYRI